MRATLDVFQPQRASPGCRHGDILQIPGRRRSVDGRLIQVGEKLVEEGSSVRLKEI